MKNSELITVTKLLAVERDWQMNRALANRLQELLLNAEDYFDALKIVEQAREEVGITPNN